MDNLRLVFTFIIAFDTRVILHFEFPFCKSIKSSTFHIFLNLNYHLKISLSQNTTESPGNLHKTVKRWLMRKAEGFNVALINQIFT